MTAKNKLIINCQATHVTAAKFGVQGGSLVLEDFKMQELSYDYSIQEEWFEALRSTLRVMNVSGKATVVAPSMFLLTKTIKIPHVDASRRNEVIAFEAEKNIPYPINEVVWDYQIISDDGIESEIFLTSMVASLADEFCDVLRSVGVIPEKIQASSILDYNAWKYCGLEPNSVILNVGARFSNMLVVRDDGLFARSIPVGGNALTQAIADSMGQSFDVAEDLKRKFFRDHEDVEMSSTAASAAEHFNASAKSVMQRIGLELRRSILNYRRTGRVATPTKIYLTGRGSSLPGFAEYLAEDQKMNVEFFNPLANVAVSGSVNQALLSACTPLMGEIIGEASTMVMADAMGVNLIPKHIVDESAFASKRPLMILSAALLALSAVPPFLLVNKTISAENNYIREFAEKTPALQERIEKLQENEEKAKAISAKIAGLEGLAKSKSNWINLFIDLEQRLMEQKDVWLDNLRVVRSSDGKKQTYNLELTGRLLLREVNPDDPTAYDTNKAIERINKLLDSFKTSTFIKDYSNVRTDPSNPRILKFDFTLVVNPDKPI